MERPVAYMGEEPYIFVSYSHKDSERVWPIIARLQADRFRVWYDDGINPGTEWDSNIASHIKNCSFFLVFISENYLASENCKDELSFVRELKKNRVLAYLDEVALPDEMQMRLGRLQAIYWPRLGDEKAYGKLMRSPGLDICREPESVPVAPEPPAEAVAPAPAETPAPAQNTEVIPDKPARSPVTPAKTSPAPNQSTKKNPLIFAGIAAAILLILVVVFVVKPSGTSKGGDSAASVMERMGVDSLTGPLSVYKNGVVTNPNGTPFAGVLKCFDVHEWTFRDQQKLDYNGETYIVAELPFMTISSYDDKNSIIIGFYDEAGEEYYFYGTYAIDGETLTFSPGGSAGTFDKECAPLKQELTYRISINFQGIWIYGDRYDVRLLGYQKGSDPLILKGSLSEGSERYEFVKSLDLVLDIAANELKKCELTLEDEEMTATANVDSFYFSEDFNEIDLDWHSVDYMLNGKMVTKDVFGVDYANIHYINNSPAGFMIIDSSNDTVHYYQNVE